MMSRFCIAVILICALSLACGGGNEPPNVVIPPTDNVPISYEWPRSTPEAQGMNGARLSQAAIDGELLGFMYSLLIVRNDSLVFERYYNDSLAAAIYDFRSDSAHSFNVMSTDRVVGGDMRVMASL